MQLITLGKTQTTRLFWALALGFAAVGFLTANQGDAVIVGAAVLLGVACLFPFYLWMLGSAPGLPIWPVFAMMTGITSVLPMLQGAEPLAAFSPEQVVTGAMTTLIFVLIGTGGWLWLSSKSQKAPQHVLMIARQHSDRLLLLFIVSVNLFQVNGLGGWIIFPGNTMSVVRSITSSLASMGVFVLAFYMGRGLLSPRAKMAFLALTCLHVLLACTSLMLASAIIPVALAALGYMLGSNNLPWKMMLLALVAISILHAGKWEMRQRYWGEGTQWTGGGGGEQLSLLSLPQFFSEWVGYGVVKLGGVAGVFGEKAPEDDTQTVFERAGLLHMLLLVQAKTPGEVPFFDGATYAPIPRLLIPRFIDDQKGSSHAANTMLSVNYGVLTIEGAQTTSVGWGLISEAYANFGYAGVLLVGACLGMFYAMVARLTVGVPMTSLRFVIGLLIMAAATRADTMGVFITMQFQGVVGVSAAAMFLMRRQRNPFAAEGGGENAESGNAERLKGKWGSAYARSGYGVASGRRAENGNGATSGMPVPGVLAALIEGERPEVADQGLKGLRDERREEHGAGNGVAAPRDVGTGGTVRTLPMQTPKRIARWMPRRVRAAVVAQQLAAEADGIRHEADGEESEKTGVRRQEAGEQQNRPRQVAVPYRNYRRYRDA